MKPEERTANVTAMISKAGWQLERIKTDSFVMMAAWKNEDEILPGRDKDSVLNVFIEGDGFAFYGGRPSFDPTPHQPLSLELALDNQYGLSAYLARPCQYTLAYTPELCSNKYWTSARYSQAVIEASSLSLDELKQKTASTSLRLYGFSGGGTVALLLAASREDVVGVVTIAANLDHKAWARQHDVPVLYESLNPPDYASKLKNIPQLHFTGSKDKIVTPETVDYYMRSLGENHVARHITIPEASHHDGWQGKLNELIRQYDNGLVFPEG